MISAVPPSNGKSTPLPLIRIVWYTPRSSRMSPPANIVHVAPGSKAASAAAAGQLGVQPPVGRVGDAVHAEQRPAAPGQRAHGRGHRVGAQEGQALAVLREVLGERGGVAARGRAGSRRPDGVGAERGEDRVRLGLDQDQRLVAVARAGQDPGHLGAVGVRGDGPEVGDRHDRDIGQRGRVVAGAGVRGVGSGVAAGSADGGVSVLAGWACRVDAGVAVGRRGDARSAPGLAPPNPSMPPLIGTAMASASRARTTSRGSRFIAGES